MQPNNNLLYGAKTYLIGNLQAESMDFARQWREKFTEEMESIGVITMSPLDEVFINFKFESEGFREKMYACLERGDFETVHREFQAIRRRDLAMVDHSQFVTCVLNPTIPTFGTIEELAVAVRANRPIFLTLTSGKKTIPLWVAGMVKPECIFDSLDDIIIRLKAINDGSWPITNENWRIFKEEYLAPDDYGFRDMEVACTAIYE